MAIKSLLKPILKLSTMLVITSVVLANTASAQWSLNNDASLLSFVTVKAEHIAEVHTFEALSGNIDNSGNIEINIELASVNTLISVRDERMQSMLFETDLFPKAVITGRVDIDALSDLSTGASQRSEVEFELSLHGASVSLTADLMINRTQAGLVASTMKPIIVKADSLGLLAGIERLREAAGLPGISRSVSVSFTVMFEQSN
ncbi:MAG: hypothetical protein COA96_05735 [SAR86 cluster bacterium]|uniref:Lipid/polyisoprenoid-binding YceI-like domain-containing protein n=1 Tax=SAR86 cluster bacterium TaxID=2030880 RepID=A0A2A5B425_9GAMM|nr:MAG: hypothetical protein COA96_05735 [SAR86 cluster bacterium]